MKSGINLISLKSIFLLTLCTVTFTLFGQSLPRIEARFSNPAFDHETRNYTLDVELNSKDSPELLFGMNLRFFYDASLLEYVKIDQFQQGYGFLGQAPVPTIGNPQSGAGLFSFNQAAGYINGGVQLLDDRFRWRRIRTTPSSRPSCTSRSTRAFANTSASSAPPRSASTRSVGAACGATASHR